MAEFQFTPTDGFNNKTLFPNPSTEDEARLQVQSLLDQLRDAYNVLNSVTDGASGADNVAATPIATSPSTVQGILEWLKAQIDSVVANSVADDSLYDVKLANAAGQIKDRLVTLKTAYDAFVATKGVANGLATLDSNGKVTLSQLPSSLYGTTTLTLTFPAFASPNYTVVTGTINIGADANEVEVIIPGTGAFTVYRGFNYVKAVNWGNINYAILSGYDINPSNLSLGTTITALSSVANINGMFVGDNADAIIVLVDAYISGSTLYLKFVNQTTTLYSSVSEIFKYFIK